MKHILFSVIQFSSVAQSCTTPCYPMNCSTPGLPVGHILLEFTQIHVHWVHDAIQPSHPLSSPFPPAPIPPGIRVFSNESILRMRWPKYWSFSFSIIPSKKSQGWSPLEWIGWISLQSKGLSRVFSNTTVQKPQFFGAQLSSWITPWKESYDQPRQHIKKQRHYFVHKGPSSQGYGFSCGHVWMWVLECEEGWGVKVRSKTIILFSKFLFFNECY